LADVFRDGVCSVSLSSISDPGLVISTTAQTLGLKEAGERTLLDQLKLHLHQKHMLLLLDNFEHLAAGAPLLAELLSGCPGLKVLVTSRAALHVSGEHQFPVPPLDLPDLNQLPGLETLLSYASVALFTQRACAVKPDFVLTEANAGAVAELCVRLDGLPLAIELAAARFKLMSPQVMLAHMLGNRGRSSLRLLTGGPRDLPPRQQTLRGTIEWSYALLDPDEQRLFIRLTSFSGGCTLEAAEEVCSATGGLSTTVLDGLASLVDKNLLRQAGQANAEPRLAMLETIREYALERLAGSGEEESTRQDHAAYYLALAEEAMPKLNGGDQELWLNRLEVEHDNLRTALTWSLDRGETEMALRLGGALWRFWFVRGHLTEGRRWLEKGLAEGSGSSPSLLAKALAGAGVLAHYQGDLGQAAAGCGESLRLYRQLGDKAGIAAALNGLALVARSGGNILAARAMYEESVALLREVGDKGAIAYTLTYLGLVVYHQGNFEMARSLSAEGLGLYREIGDRLGCSGPLTTLGMANVRLGDFETARSVLEECLVITRSLGDRRSSARALHQLGGVAFAEGDCATSRVLRQEALAIFDELGDRVLVSQFIMELAEVVAAQGDYLLAAQVFGAAETMGESIGAKLLPAHLEAYQRGVASARAGLSEQAFAGAWAEGRNMSTEQVLAALNQPAPMESVSPQSLMVPELVTSSTESTAGVTGESDASHSPANPGLHRPVRSNAEEVESPGHQIHPARLSQREVEVLRLVAQGLTDAQVAERLILSARTVNSHLRSIYGKLDVPSRTAATRYAIDHNLLR
jgi:predicted ATPase/DNA-binding CsgD family transcriptional regulator